MNCCNDFGQCQQGHGCPARSTVALPQSHPALKLADHIEYWAAIAIAGGATLFVLGGGAGYLYARFWA